MDSRLIELLVELLWPTRYVSPLVQKIHTIQADQIQVRVGFLRYQVRSCNGNRQERGNISLIISFTKKGRSDDLADTAKVVSRKMLLLEI